MRRRSRSGRPAATCGNTATLRRLRGSVTAARSQADPEARTRAMSPPTTTREASTSTTSRSRYEGAATIALRETVRRATAVIAAGDKAPDFDLEGARGE